MAAGEPATSFQFRRYRDQSGIDRFFISRPRCVTRYFSAAGKKRRAKKRRVQMFDERSLLFEEEGGEGEGSKDRIRKVKNCLGRVGGRFYRFYRGGYDFDGTVNNRYRLATGNSLIYGRIGNRGGQTQRLTLKYFIRGS